MTRSIKHFLPINNGHPFHLPIPIANFTFKQSEGRKSQIRKNAKKWSEMAASS
jgi:hypothetical protein